MYSMLTLLFPLLIDTWRSIWPISEGEMKDGNGKDYELIRRHEYIAIGKDHRRVCKRDSQVGQCTLSYKWLYRTTAFRPAFGPY